jgi:hypothetical protein
MISNYKMAAIIVGLGIMWGLGYFFHRVDTSFNESEKEKASLLGTYYSTWFFTGSIIKKLHEFDEFFTEENLYRGYQESKNLEDFRRIMNSWFSYYAGERLEREAGAWD